MFSSAEKKVHVFKKFLLLDQVVKIKLWDRNACTLQKCVSHTIKNLF